MTRGGQGAVQMGGRQSGWSLRRALVRLLLVAGLLPALAFGTLSLVSDYNAERRELAERLATSTRLTAASIDDFLAYQVAGVALLADARADAATDWDADLASLLERFPGLLTALVADAEGQVIAARQASGEFSGRVGRVADREYFRVPRRTLKPHVSGAFQGRNMGNDALVAVSAPLVRDGHFDGVVEASILVDTFTGTLGEAFVSRGYEMLLVDRRQRVIAATPGMGMAFLQQVDLDRRFAAPGDGRAVFRPGILKDGDGFVARAEMKSGWTQILVLRQPPLLRGVTGQMLILLGVLVVVTLGVTTAVWWQMRQLDRGTGDLLRTLRHFALGTASTGGLDVEMPEELRPVAAAIDDLAMRLNTAYAGLNEALERQRELSESLRGVVEAREREIAERTAELERAVAELDRISRTDALTGCLNYRGLRETTAALWANARRTDEPLSALAIDIDFFKPYNDRYGHQEGDNALSRFAGAVRTALYHHGDTLVRSGGEEFLVLLPDTTIEQALRVAERVLASVRRAEIQHEAAPQGVLTASIGVATREPGDGDDPEGMLRRADAALYRAKRAGRDRVST